MYRIRASRIAGMAISSGEAMSSVLRWVLVPGLVLALALPVAAFSAEQPSEAGHDALAGEPLDLEPPHISEMFLPAELERLVNAMTDPELEIEEIEVEGGRLGEPPSGTPVIWPGIAAPFWALLNPADAWRILLPWLPEQAAAINHAPDATASDLAPAAWTHDIWPYDRPALR